jgi:hypothetical protein
MGGEAVADNIAHDADAPMVMGAGKGSQQRCRGAPGLADRLPEWASGKNKIKIKERRKGAL